MGLNTVLRFKISSGNIDFYEEEVSSLLISHIQKYDLYKCTNDFSTLLGPGFFNRAVYGMTLLGNPYKIFKVTFRLTKMGSTTTISKIEDLFDQVDLDTYQPKILYCYYKYHISTATVVPVQMKRTDMKWVYTFGQLSTGTLPVEFCETYVQGVGVLSEGIVKS